MQKVLLGKIGLDAHWRGVAVIAKYLTEKGFEVVYVGNQSPEKLAEAALQEDPTVIGISMLSGSHIALLSEFFTMLKKLKVSDIPVIVGGIIPKQDKKTLEEIGVAKIFTPGESLEELTEYIKSLDNSIYKIR
jgi:methylmalonyl-CoA mutase, C-terminal domain